MSGREHAQRVTDIAAAAADLPEMQACFSQGTLSEDQVAILARFATADTDTYWASEAPKLSVGHLQACASQHRKLAPVGARVLRHRIGSVRLWRRRCGNDSEGRRRRRGHVAPCRSHLGGGCRGGCTTAAGTAGPRRHAVGPGSPLRCACPLSGITRPCGP